MTCPHGYPYRWACEKGCERAGQPTTAWDGTADEFWNAIARYEDGSYIESDAAVLAEVLALAQQACGFGSDYNAGWNAGHSQGVIDGFGGCAAPRDVRPGEGSGAARRGGVLAGPPRGRRVQDVYVGR